MTTIELGTGVIAGGWGMSASEAGMTINGGMFQRPPVEWDPQMVAWTNWHRVNTALSIKAPNVTNCGTRYDNVGDAIAVGGINQYVGGDDFLENDGNRSGLCFNCKVDGAMNIFSCRPGGTPRDGSKDTYHIEKNIVRLWPYYNSYNTPKYGFNRHASFFKWSPYAPMTILQDNVFCTDSMGYDGLNSLNPPSTLVSASGTVLLWTGEGDWPAESLAAWRKADPSVEYLHGQDAIDEWDKQCIEWSRRG
jgi:hypothetical protein